MGSLGGPTNPPLGLIVSSMNICRIPGDVGNTHTFGFPVVQAMAKDSLLVRMVSDHDYEDGFLDNFIEAGMELVAQGAVGIITSCGFLARAQKEFSRRLPVPVASSSLMQIPSIRSILRPDQAIGVISFDGQRLNEGHLNAVGVTDCSNIYIAGPPPEGGMKRCLRDGEPYDYPVLEAELVAAARKLVDEHPDIGAIVLECTQFPPFALAIQRALGLPVYDVFTLASWFYSGLARVPFPSWTEEEQLDAKAKRPRAREELLESSRVEA